MNTPLEYIENYFVGDLSKEEKKAFEERCEKDLEFAEEVSFYIATRDALQRDLIYKKKLEFQEQYKKLISKQSTSQHFIGRFTPYAAAMAACLLLFVTWIFIFNHPSAEKLATNYIQEDLTVLSVTMGSSEDKLQEGISLYNKKEYTKAETIFSSLVRDKKYRIEAIKYLGLTYLIEGKYNKAIEQFELLSAIPNLYANSGPFYKAVALMKRGEEQDIEEATRLLEDVVKEDLPGKKHAEKWLNEL